MCSTRIILGRSLPCNDVLTPLVVVALDEIEPDGLQLTPVEYQGRCGLLDYAKELKPCCLWMHATTPLVVVGNKIDNWAFDELTPEESQGHAKELKPCCLWIRYR